MMDWQRTSIAPNGTHHLIEGEPLYPARFQSVLKFHSPGLAPAMAEDGSTHIDISGEPVYAKRYARTFGFYENRAAVAEEGGWCHLLPDGEPLYQHLYAWCGNFQNGHCAVRSLNGSYLHIRSDGNDAYPERWSYAGDYRDGCAVVQRQDGLHTHIDIKGKILHKNWFLDLDVFHKGFARAQDIRGWMHVDFQGRPLYERRFAAVEPFYNGQARVERQDGGLEVIDEEGQTLRQLRAPRQTALQRLSSVMVGFWGTQVIRAAVELRALDSLPGTADEVAGKTSLRPEAASRLLRALWELGLVTRSRSLWVPTDTGTLLCRTSSSGMAEAALHWGTEHYKSWMELGTSLKTGSAGFEKLYGQPFFDWLMDNPDQLKRYQRAMHGYAKHDYRDMPNLLPLDGVRHVIDAGGGSGALIEHLLRERTDLRGTLLDLPEVIASVSSSRPALDRLRLIAGDLFSPWPCSGELVVLARVLHDWDDEQARAILVQARRTLQPGGRVALIEFVLSDDRPDGGLLDLNMLTICGARERTLKALVSLAGSAGFRVTDVAPLTTYGALLVLTPEGESHG